LSKQNSEGFIPITTDDSLLYSLRFSSNTHDSTFFYLDRYDRALKPTKTIDLRIPKYSSVAFANSTYTLFLNSWKVYYHNNGTQLNKEITNNRLKAFAVYPILGSDDLVVLGELEINHVFKTGFFKIKLNDSSSTDIGIIEEKRQSYAAQNSLKYSGHFTQDSGDQGILYYCNKNSKIFSMYANRSFRIYNTDDHTPLPEIVYNGNGAYFYKRGATWSTNCGMICDHNNYYVFSARSPVRDSLTIDVYDKKSFQYQYSSKLFYDHKRAPDLNYVYHYQDQAFLAFDNSLVSFIYSR
jgi:hypothetical protein